VQPERQDPPSVEEDVENDLLARPGADAAPVDRDLAHPAQETEAREAREGDAHAAGD
jgi:hypothetical protein